ncbi:hypothetical protein [Streptomyces sp. MBT49]|uniref:hypothetical protein n=1 Tax=Streptomyces sp. MBT49 TaxID=1488380 RepID=UPI0027DC7723|nr:hypothetical protein [Streptomyces sp. MBT49]
MITSRIPAPRDRPGRPARRPQVARLDPADREALCAALPALRALAVTVHEAAEEP